MRNDLILYQFPSRRRIANPSVFCLKLETFLKMAEIPYTIKPTLNVGRGPTKKLPYIEDGDIKMGDSGRIIEYLSNRYQVSLDENLTEEECALATSVQRMLEESYYFAICWTRWLDPKVWPKWSKSIGHAIPKILRGFVLRRLQKRLYRQLFEQGTARLSPEAIYQKAKEEMDALSTLLGEGPYFFKDRPSKIDACIYAFCAIIYTLPEESPLREDFLKRENLVKFMKMMHEKYYPDFTL